MYFSTGQGTNLAAPAAPGSPPTPPGGVAEKIRRQEGKSSHSLATLPADLYYLRYRAKWRRKESGTLATVNTGIRLRTGSTRNTTAGPAPNLEKLRPAKP